MEPKCLLFRHSLATDSYPGPDTVEPLFTNASHHEQIGSRTNLPKKKVSGDERCRITNTQAGNNGWLQTGSIGGRASVAV
jgi:hypothetical protein